MTEGSHSANPYSLINPTLLSQRVSNARSGSRLMLRLSGLTHLGAAKRARKTSKCKRLLCLAVHVTSRRQHTRMPPLILSVGITEPPVARPAVHGGRVVANITG